VLLEYSTLEEAKAAIAGAAGKTILDQPIYADFAFVRGNKQRDNRHSGRGRGRRDRDRSQSPEQREPRDLASRIADE
jgi:RNA-binding protein 8A